VIVDRAHRIPRALAACAALGLALPGQAAGQEHHQHPAPAEQQPASAPRSGEPPRTVVPVRAELATGPEGAVGTRAAREREAVEVRLRLTDPATGRPLTGLQPMAWVDVRRDEQTSLATCQQRVGAFVEATLHVKHGEINLTQPVDDLNGHYLVTLARGGTVVVIDPVKGFGRTRMLTAVPLGAEAVDWAATPDDRRIFVTVPSRGEVAVINTHSWRVETRIPAGARPTKARMQPDGRRLWVSDQGAGVVVVDAERLAAVATIPTGAGPHAIAFSDDGATAFVASRGAGTVSVVDVAALRKTGEARTGTAPADVAWSSVRGAAFVVDEADGFVSVVDARGTVAERIPFTPGIRHIRFAPDPADAHGAHGGHGDGHGAGNGNLAFVLNPRAGTLQIYDLAQRQVVRTLSGAPEPDQVAFTGQFAYIRAAGTASVALIPLANPTAGAVGPHDYFAAGSTVPGSIAADSLGDVLVPQPGMHDAIYAANPAERMVYSYHYMEGMPVPHGGLTTYGFTPRAVRVVTRQVRETEPGVYAATLKIDRPGDYDLIFRSPEPYFLGCYGFRVERDPSLHSARDLRIGVEPGGELRPGRVAVRFRVSDADQGAPVAGLDDFGVQLASTDGWRQRARGVAVGEGVYEAAFEIPAPGVYVASFEVPSRGVTLRDLSPAWITVRP
jgi:YVTN family beta-propeller protein